VLFRKDMQPSCSYCRDGISLGFGEIVCRRHGIVNEDFHCGSFYYEPTKREPEAARKRAYSAGDSGANINKEKTAVAVTPPVEESKKETTAVPVSATAVAEETKDEKAVTPEPTSVEETIKEVPDEVAVEKALEVSAAMTAVMEAEEAKEKAASKGKRNIAVETHVITPRAIREYLVSAIVPPKPPTEQFTKEVEDEIEQLLTLIQSST